MKLLFSYARGKSILNLSQDKIQTDKFEIDLIPKKQCYDNIYLGKVEEMGLRELLNKCYTITNDYGFVFFSCKYGHKPGEMDKQKLIKFINYETYFSICASVYDGLYYVALRKTV